MTVSRRDFTKLLALTGSSAFIPGGTDRVDWLKSLTDSPLPKTPISPDEKFWKEVRARFLMPNDVAFINAANICPTSLPVLESLERNARQFEGNPSQAAKAKLAEGREESRRQVAQALRVTPEEIVLTRNTSEANNFVSSGLHLGAGDEVVVFGESHPSNLNAWRDKGKRFGFSVVEVASIAPHPGTVAYVEAFMRALTPRTKLVALTHVTNTIGDMLPVAELCKLARERGVMTLVDGAQSFGVLDVDLSVMNPDFYSGSAHKWPCGPKEVGVLFVNKAVHDRISPSVVSLYPGAVGISKTMEAFGQRDDVAIGTLAAAMKWQAEIGRATIEARSRQLAQRIVDEVSKIDGVMLWTSRDPSRYAAIITFKPGNLDARKLATTLYEKDRIVVTAGGTQARPGLRLSPHFYNTMEEIDRAIGAIRGYVTRGLPA